jgi:poly-beta-1,6 N-acetyl-D-glucosamine synthase
MPHSKQIFQTSSTLRWRNFKWSFRILLIIALFFLIVLIIALARGGSPSPLNIKSMAKAYANKLDPSNPLTLSYNRNKKYKGFKNFLEKKIKEDSVKQAKATAFAPVKQLPFIRAAFYTPWTARTSLPDLQKNGDKLNTIFPEWFFIDTTTRSGLQTRIDSMGIRLMKQKGLSILPILTNFNSAKRAFDGTLLHGILNDAQKQKVFISQLVNVLQLYHLQGINIDFEELLEPTNEPLTNFQKNLYEALHAKNMLVTMDVSVKNDDYDYKKLSDYNDYIILMAYDQYSNTETGPGPVSAQKWIEEALDWTDDRIESSKIILGIAGYGYDWTIDDEGKKVVKEMTYTEAINKAKIANAKISYDNASYNLHYSYIEEFADPSTGDMVRIPHEVWFTDAATSFNVLRFNDEYATAGTALWHLGGEDQRIWSFYNINLSNDALQQHPFSFNKLSTIPYDINQKPTATGEGELLTILYTPQEGKIDLQIDSLELLITEQNYRVLPSGYVYQKFGEDKTPMGPGHKIILTFDDGPSADFTPKILRILEKEKVPATFFVVGLNAEQNIPLLKRIYKNGYEIGNHTFTHGNIALMNPERAELEMKATRLLIECITGRSTILFRAPYNADSEPQTYEEIEPIARSRKDNYITIGESIDPNDWEDHVSADSIVVRTIRLAEATDASIILLHDAGGETRQATVDALPLIIDYFKKKGCVFTTVSGLIGKTRDDVMPVLSTGKESWMRRFNFFFAETTYWGSHILFALFIFGIILSVGRMIAMGILAYAQRKREFRSLARVSDSYLPRPSTVSVIIPAYNEEVNAVRTIKSILAQDYPELQVVFVDDGSKDNTYATVKEVFKDVANVHVYTKLNGGKASALNFGIEQADSKYVVCIDADTQLKTDAVSMLIQQFTHDKVGAVAGNVKVGNEVNMITRWQSIEYITSQNFDRRAFDLLNCITVVPGAIGAFKKDAVKAAGGFTTDTLAEDCDLTMRLHLSGYEIRNCTDAISYTEAPETMRQFMKQRFRWSFGVIQCFWKHRQAVFNPQYKNFGMVALPNILIYQIILPCLAPLADLILLFSLIAAAFNIIPASIDHIILYYIVFTLVDVAGAALAFAFEKEDYRKLIWLIPQRLIYRQLMYYILLKSFNKAIKGELQGWGALKRTGNVKEVLYIYK